MSLSARGPIADFAIFVTPTSSLKVPSAPIDTVNALHGWPDVCNFVCAVNSEIENYKGKSKCALALFK